MKASRALITGAGTRLGRAMALYLGARGVEVVLHYATSREGAESAAEEIRAKGGNARTLQADLLVEEQSNSLVEQAVEALAGPLDLLVNNASIFEFDTIKTATRESWDRHLESNLRAPFVLSQHFAEQAPTAGTDANGEPVARALIVNMIDQRVRKLTPSYMTYTIAKMGLWALTRTSAQALAPEIRVNAIGPGPTLAGQGQTEESFRDQRSKLVLGRGSNVEDITSALGYLIEADSVTGQLLCTDGGQHLGWETPDVFLK